MADGTDPSTPIQNDINQAVAVGGVPPTPPPNIMPPTAPPAGTPGLAPDAAPNTANLPATTRSAGTAAPQINPQQVQEIAKHASIGKIYSTLVGQKSPGQLWRGILAGALMGGASSGGGEGGFLGGMNRGGAAVMQNQKAQQQQQLENQLKMQKAQEDKQLAADDHLYHQAATAKANAETAEAAHRLDKQTADELAATKAQQSAQLNLLSQTPGAQQVKFTTADGPQDYTTIKDFMQQATQNPSILHPTDTKNYERHFVVIPTSGEDVEAKFNGQHWENAKTGEPISVGLDAHIVGFDIQTNQYKVPVTTSGKDLRTAYPSLKDRWKDNQTYQVSQEQKDAFQSQNYKNKKDEADIADKNSQAAERYSNARKNDAQTKAMGKLGVPLSENYVADPDAFTKSEADLRKTLATQQQTVPQYFSTAYAIGHYDSEIGKNFSPRPYNRPGMPIQPSSAEVTSFIRQFINPTYDENKFGAMKEMEKEYASSRPNTAGGNAIAYNTAINHLGMLYDASVALKTNDIQKVNQITQWLSEQTGHNVKPNFDAIKAALVGEIGKTFKGGAVDIPEAERIEQTIEAYESPDQLINSGVIETYAKLMKSKADVLDDHYYTIKGRHPENITQPSSVAILNKLQPKYAEDPTTHQRYVSHQGGAPGSWVKVNQ